MFTVPFLEPCAGCGGFAEIKTESEYLVIDAGHANVGEIISCSLCECQGIIVLNDKAKYCYWNEELCEVCWSRLVEKISELIKVG